MYKLETIDKKLEASLQTTWNARVVEYDNERFPFNGWILNRIQMMGYGDLDDLTNIHEVVGSEKAYEVSKQLCRDTNLPEFRRLVNQFVREEIVSKGELELPIAVQRFLNVRIMLPHKPESIFPFHTGLLYGHGPASRSLWLPLTDVRSDEMKNASMQIIDINRSRELIQEAVEKRLSVDEMTGLFGQESRQVKAGPGQVCLFSQENIHGNFVNDTGKTRVSIDFRLAEAQFGDQLCRKIAGGYFEIIANTQEEEDRLAAKITRNFDNGKRNVLYLNNATPSTYGIPVHLQRYMAYDYISKKRVNDVEFELFELEDMLHLPTLNYIVDVLQSNVFIYSVFALPEDKDFRTRIIDTAIRNGLTMHFFNEDMVIQNEDDKQVVEALISFAKYGQDGVRIGLPQTSAAAA